LRAAAVVERKKPFRLGPPTTFFLREHAATEGPSPPAPRRFPLARRRAREAGSARLWRHLGRTINWRASGPLGRRRTRTTGRGGFCTQSARRPSTTAVFGESRVAWCSVKYA
jgi:hypothetical protein